MTLSDLLDRFDLLLDTPNAIPQLRQFILQLAVQGRLTEQNPDDEPAEALLEEMGAEKNRLKEAGDYKYQKKMPPITEEDLTLPTPLPRGWVWVRFGALGKVTGGGTPKKSNPDYWGGAIPWVSPKDMGDTVIRQTQDYITEKGLDDSSAKRIPESSVLIVGRSGILQRTLPVAINAVECTVNQDLKVLTPFNREMARYIQIMLKGFQPHILKHLIKTGTTVESLKYTDFQLQPYPLPPLEEQKRIVETVGRLMDECDALEATQTQMRETQSAATVSATHALRTAPDTDALRTAWDRVATHFDTLTATPNAVDELRQTILQLAVQGRLTEQNPDDEPAEALLEQIQMEKQRLYDAGEIRKPKTAPPIEQEDGLPKVPAHWIWTRLADTIFEMKAGSSPKCPGHPADPDTWGVLRTTAVQPLKYWQHENKELPDKVSPRKDHETKERDLLITRAGPRDRVGVACSVEETRSKLMFSDKIIRCRGPLVSYLAIAINGGFPASYIDDKKSGMAESQMNISQTNLRTTPIPLPPLAEQQRIVETVGQLMDVCDQLEERLGRSEATGEQWAKAALVGAIDRRKVETV